MCPPAKLVLLQRIHACLEENQLWLVARKQQRQPVFQLAEVLVICTVVRQGHVIRAGAASAPGPVLGACANRLPKAWGGLVCWVVRHGDTVYVGAVGKIGPASGA